MQLPVFPPKYVYETVMFIFPFLFYKQSLALSYFYKNCYITLDLH